MKTRCPGSDFPLCQTCMARIGDDSTNQYLNRKEGVLFFNRAPINDDGACDRYRDARGETK